MTRQLLPTLFLIFALAACSAPTPTSAPTSTPAPTATAVLPTETPTPLPSPTVTATSTPEIRFTRQCLQAQNSEISLEEVASGIFLQRATGPGTQYVLQDSQTQKKHRLPSESNAPVWTGGPVVSPNREMLASMELIEDTQIKSTKNILWIVDNRAKVLAEIMFDRTDLGLVRWLDNERLIIYTGDYGSLLVLNPFTREQREISNVLPDLLTHSSPGDPWWRVEYSPDLEWVAYYYQRNDSNRDSQLGTIVRNIVTKQNLWQSTGGDGGEPVWSPNGQELAIVNLYDGQLYLVRRSGEIKPILNVDLPHKASSPSWSPDGMYLAFWNADNLLIYDRKDNQIIEPCISNLGSPIHWSPLWSPNGQQIIINNEFTTGGVLIDLREKIAYPLASTSDGFYPFEWMNPIP